MVDNVQNGGVADVYAALNANAKAGSTAGKSAVSDTQDRFLKLLVTQMKNQDPLNPMDNAQVTSQMAQLSTVSGIDKLNVTLQALSDSMLPNQTLQAATMIGHGVLVPGEGVELFEGNAFGGLELGQSVDGVKISIHDKSGVLVRNISLGEQSAGLVNWQWDGLDNDGASVADGNYTFSVEATSEGKVVTDATALEFGMVGSVMQGKQGVTLSVGNLGDVALSQVRQIL
jgi:flagellar basal-body rod modification protein FlgD